MLGKRLKQLRGKRTQAEVAKQLGISRARYSHYENERTEPDTYMLQKLADFYNVSVDYLLGNDKEDIKKESDIVDLFEAIKKHPYVKDPKTGRLIPIGETEAKIIKDILIGYLRREGHWPDDNGNGNDLKSEL